MASESKRATVYLDPDLHQALKVKAAVTDKSISELVNDAIRVALAEDEEDLRAIEERVGEPLYAFEDVLKWLKEDGKL